jgi:uncharacterized protein
MQAVSTPQQHEDLATALLNPSAYPHAVDRVERIDTHISTVLLAGDYAYKIKKPVDLGFLDFSTLEKRRRSCVEEVRLNRRTAPTVYLDVVPILGPATAARIAVSSGETPIEYAVRMRRFDPRLTLDHLAARGLLESEVIDRLAERVATFHAGAAEAPPQFGTPQTVQRQAETNIRALRTHLNSAVDRARLDALAEWSESEWRAQSARMAARASSGCVRECHGDLHLANIVLLDGEPVPFDGIEFSDELRFIDIASDIAFTFMDLLDHGLARLAWRFLGAYLERTGDYDGLPLLRYYAVYRALVRAEVALIRLRQPHLTVHMRLREHASFEQYLGLAESLTRAGARIVVVMNGLSGSGKSTVALELAQQLAGVRIRSDVERKRLFGFAPQDDTGHAVYSEAATARTYARMADLARAAVAAGVPVVVDAAFLRKVERDAFRVLAAQLGARFALVACEAPHAVMRSRVVDRVAAGRDPSEATLDVLDRQLGWAEPLAQEERVDCTVIDTEAGWASVEHHCTTIVSRLHAPSSAR